MAPFDYILAFVSILVGLAVADVAASLHRVLRARRRVRWDWLPLAAAILVVLAVLDFWWAFYTLGRLATWTTYGGFLPMVALLFVMFLLASAALPDELEPGAFDLAAYYRDNARYFWSLFALFVGLSIVVTGMAARGRASLSAAAQGPNAVLVLALASLAVVTRRAYHAVLVPLLLVTLGLLWSRLSLAS